MPNMANISATIIFAEGPYKNRIYKVKDPTAPLPEEVRVVDGGNTIESPEGYIVGHYIGMHEGDLPDPESLPPC